MGNRDDLLTAAKKVILAGGYSVTTLRDVTDEAGVSMAAVGYHFGSLQALLTTALVEALDDWGAQFAAAVISSDAATSLEERIEALLDTVRHHRGLALASLEATIEAQRIPLVRQRLADGQEQGRRGLAAASAGLPEDLVSDGAVRSVGSVHLALVTGLLVQSLIDPDRTPDAATVVDGLRTLLVDRPSSTEEVR